MAHPKRRTSKSKKRMRRSHHALGENLYQYVLTALKQSYLIVCAEAVDTITVGLW